MMKTVLIKILPIVSNLRRLTIQLKKISKKVPSLKSQSKKKLSSTLGYNNNSFPKWKDSEDIKLLQLYQTLNGHWSSIFKFFSDCSPEEIEDHFYEILKKAAWQAKEDIENNQNEILQKANISRYHLKWNPLTMEKEELLAFIPYSLLQLGSDNINLKKRPVEVKKEPLFSLNSINQNPPNVENDKLLSDNIKKAVDGFSWKKANNYDEESDDSDPSDSDVSARIFEKMKHI